jgi:hypothetical protein
MPLAVGIQSGAVNPAVLHQAGVHTVCATVGASYLGA